MTKLNFQQMFTVDPFGKRSPCYHI